MTTMLGMLEELSDRGRLDKIDSYAGISAGAILAAFCATRPIKNAVKELQEILIHHCKDAIKPHYRFLNMPLSALFKKSLLDDSGLANLLKERLEGAPHETMLVLDGTTGLNMLNQAREFHETVQVTGLILTKLDGTARGGAVVSVVDELGVPVKFVGVGEGMEDLQTFEPRSFVDALFPEDK